MNIRQFHKSIPTITNILILFVFLSIIAYLIQSWLVGGASTNQLVLTASRLVTGFMFGGVFGALLFLVTSLWRKQRNLPFVISEADESELNDLKNKLAENRAFATFLPGGALDLAYKINAETEEFLYNEVSRYGLMSTRYLFLAIVSSIGGIWFVLSISSNSDVGDGGWVQPALSQLAIVGVLQVLAIFFLRAAASADRLRYKLIESVAETKRQRIAIGLSAEDFIEGRSFARSIPAIVGSNNNGGVDSDFLSDNTANGLNDNLLQQRLRFLLDNLK